VLIHLDLSNMNMRMNGVDWRPFQKEFPILLGTREFVSLSADRSDPSRHVAVHRKKAG
jgi:hypothetical protein